MPSTPILPLRRATWCSPDAWAATKYYDMDKAIAAAFELVKAELGVEL